MKLNEDLSLLVPHLSSKNVSSPWLVVVSKRIVEVSKRGESEDMSLRPVACDGVAILLM